MNKIKEWIRLAGDKLLGLALLSDIVKWLNGKKLYLGLLQFALWAIAFGVPQFFPEHAYLSEIALRISEFLENIGVDNQLLLKSAGVTTAIGAGHRITKSI